MSAGETAVFFETDQLGAYHVSQFDSQGEILHAAPFVVNLFHEPESDIAPQDLIQVGQRELTISETARGGQRELWQWAAVAALLVMSLEWWIHHRGTGGVGARLHIRRAQGSRR